MIRSWSCVAKTHPTRPAQNFCNSMGLKPAERAWPNMGALCWLAEKIGGGGNRASRSCHLHRITNLKWQRPNRKRSLKLTRLSHERMGHALHASAWLTAASWAKTRLAHHRDPIGFRSNMNGVETAQLSGVPWKPARLNAASVAAIQSRTQWPFQNLRLTSPFVPFAPVFERAIQCGNLIKSEIGQ